jgi:trk system potassium uptake protein TrkH
LAVVAVFSVVLFASAILLAASLEASSVEASALDVLYESVSATATVGLSRSLTPRLPLLGKLVIIATMYFGRVGPISLAVALGRKAENQNAVSEPVEYMSMG